MLDIDQNSPLGANIDKMLSMKKIYFNPNNWANINIKNNQIHSDEVSAR